MAISPKRLPFQSSLEKHPEHVRAIGMISIESGNLDIMIADLLSVVLNVPEKIGHAIYLTPRSAMARIELFENVAKYAFPVTKTDNSWDDEPRKLMEIVNQRNASDQKRVEGLLKRARAIANKRHQNIHEAWGLRIDTKEVARRPIPIKPGSEFTAIPVATLTTIINDLRLLIDDVIDLKNEFAKRKFEAMWARAQPPSSEKIQRQTPAPRPKGTRSPRRRRTT